MKNWMWDDRRVLRLTQSAVSTRVMAKHGGFENGGIFVQQQRGKYCFRPCVAAEFAGNKFFAMGNSNLKSNLQTEGLL